MFSFLSPNRAKHDRDSDSESGNDCPGGKIVGNTADAKEGMKSVEVEMVKSFDETYGLLTSIPAAQIFLRSSESKYRNGLLSLGITEPRDLEFQDVNELMKFLEDHVRINYRKRIFASWTNERGEKKDDPGSPAKFMELNGTGDAGKDQNDLASTAVSVPVETGPVSLDESFALEESVGQKSESMDKYRDLEARLKEKEAAEAILKQRLADIESKLGSTQESSATTVIPMHPIPTASAGLPLLPPIPVTTPNLQEDMEKQQWAAERAVMKRQIEELQAIKKPKGKQKKRSSKRNDDDDDDDGDEEDSDDGGDGNDGEDGDDDDRSFDSLRVKSHATRLKELKTEFEAELKSNGIVSVDYVASQLREKGLRFVTITGSVIILRQMNEDAKRPYSRSVRLLSRPTEGRATSLTSFTTVLPRDAAECDKMCDEAIMAITDLNKSDGCPQIRFVLEFRNFLKQRLMQVSGSPLGPFKGGLHGQWSDTMLLATLTYTIFMQAGLNGTFAGL